MDKKIDKKKLSFSVIYRAVAEGGYIASVPFLSGCHTQGDTLEETEANIKEAIGDTLEETEANIKEAISLYLESLLSRKENIPQEAKMFQGRVEIQV